MKIIRSFKEIQEYSQQVKQIGKTIGLIDTEGDLHDGHMSLVKIAKENADVVVLNIFHTLDYFRDSPEEYEAKLKMYEQDFIKKEIELCKLNNVDVFFLPLMDDVYSDIPNIHLDNPSSNISIPLIDQLIIDRPNHHPVHMKFILGTKKMYNIILPNITVLGQKDAHQVFVLKSVIKQLDLPIKVIIAPTVRDSSGVPFSSRNRFLSTDDYNNFISVYETLQEVASWPDYPSTQHIKMYIDERITRNKGIVNYIDICCAETLEELNSIDRKSVIIVNVKFGDVDELTDNIIIEPR